MNTSFLFAIESNSEDVLVSESPKGSNKVNFIERISRDRNNLLFNAVVTLTSIVQAEDFDPKLFNAMDKVCQLIYLKHSSKN
jgi:hypothetical protein